MGAEKLIFSDTREVETETTENLIESHSSKTSFNLNIRNNNLHCGETPLQELQIQSIEQCKNKIVALLPAYNEEVSMRPLHYMLVLSN